MAELDVMLSETLKRAATPGDPTGVADAIRARVAAGDTGTPASTSGFGARPRWGFWLVLGVVLMVVSGGAIAFGTPVLAPLIGFTASAPTTPSATVEPSTTAARTATPSASPTPSPSPTPTPSITPPPVEPPPPPPPPADTTPPFIAAISAAPDTVYSANGTSTTITVAASDDVGVAGVAISWAGVHAGSASMQPGWTYVYTVPQGTPTGSITFTVQAVDAAGNVGDAKSVVVTVAF